MGTKSLVQLYEEPEKPNDALSYLKKTVGGSEDDKSVIEKLTAENSDLKAKVAELEASQSSLQARLVELQRTNLWRIFLHRPKKMHQRSLWRLKLLSPPIL